MDNNCNTPITGKAYLEESSGSDAPKQLIEVWGIVKELAVPDGLSVLDSVRYNLELATLLWVQTSTGLNAIGRG
jgi:hypothetical protein